MALGLLPGHSRFHCSGWQHSGVSLLLAQQCQSEKLGWEAYGIHAALVGEDCLCIGGNSGDDKVGRGDCGSKEGARTILVGGLPAWW